jgi:large subunit ribosomal protein L29
MKAQDYSQLSDKDLTERIVQVREELTKMRFTNSVSGLENPNVLRSKRREVARLLTELNVRSKSTK